MAALPKARWGRSYRASIRAGKGVVVHLGLYENPWHAALAHDFAADLLKKPRSPLRIPGGEEPTADQVREILERVRARVGLSPAKMAAREVPPTSIEILTLFEVVVVPFWQGEAASDHGGVPGTGLEAAAERLVDAAHILFWSRAAGHPTPLEAMTRLLSRRLELAFRRSDLTREVFDDEGDDERGVARWLVYPDARGGSLRAFVDEIRQLYPDILNQGPNASEADIPDWAEILELKPPFNLGRVRAAFLNMTRKVHPDKGGTDAEFVKLRVAYEAAVEFCRGR